MKDFILTPSILYIDDEATNLEVFKRAFGSQYLVKTALSAFEALDILQKENFALIISDQKMPGMSGVELCQKLYEAGHESLRMILTAYSDPEILLQAINKGHVHDYIVKPWRKSALQLVIDKAWQAYRDRFVKIKELKEKVDRLEICSEEIDQLYSSSSFLYKELPGLSSIRDILSRAAPTDSTILLLGETGTGKEALAREIHQLSSRKNKVFLPTHLAALSLNLLETELFGHEKGAFTGADKIKKGRFERAHEGSLFLDELGEIPSEIQVKLLRVLQERKVERLGGEQFIDVNVRLIAATHKDLAEEVRQGRFREDLYFRLNVISIEVPPLRKRKEDIPFLARFFLKKICQTMNRELEIDPLAIEALQDYDWPGNIREMENIMERAVILTRGEKIEVSDLNLPPQQVNIASFSANFKDQFKEKEKNDLIKALQETKGNISEAARLMNLPRSTFFNRLKKYSLV